jgi:hypothetical protein
VNQLALPFLRRLDGHYRFKRLVVDYDPLTRIFRQRPACRRYRRYTFTSEAHLVYRQRPLVDPKRRIA